MQISLSNLNFLYSSYLQKINLENFRKRNKTVSEEKNYWKSKHDKLSKELNEKQELLNSQEKQLKEKEEDNVYLLEEKNFFLNQKLYKNTNDVSFLEKSNDLNQSRFMGFGANNIQPIPLNNTTHNNLFELTIFEDENQQKDF